MKDYSSDTKKTVTVLKDVISRKGYDYIYDNAQDVHRTLIEKGIDKSIADVTLYALAAETAREDKSNIAADVEEKLLLNEEGSAVVSDMFSLLYDRKAMSEMKKKEFKGLETFLKGEWEMTSRGASTWQYSGGSKTDYSYKYNMTIRVADRTLVEKDLKDKLRENPFLKAEDICSWYEEQIDGIISAEFEDYCTSDDYYPPVVEDFPGNIKYYMDDFLPKHGLEMTDDDYEWDESDIYW